MELKQLRAFVAVAEELHFGRAAEALHTTQPALSARVRGLETELGVRLLFRTTRTVRLSPAGESFLPEARRTLEQASRAARAARETGAAGAESLRIGGVDSATAGLLPTVVGAFRAARPATDIEVVEMLSGQALHCLRNRTLDIAFSRVPAPPNDPSLSSRPVLDERLFVAVGADHRLARAKAPRLASVAAEPLVIPARAHRPILFDIVHDYFRSKGFEPNVHQEVNERHVAIAMVAAGLGVAIVPEWVRDFARPDVVFFALPGGAPSIPTHVVWRTEEPMRAVHDFLEQVPDRAARPVRRH